MKHNAESATSPMNVESQLKQNSSEQLVTNEAIAGTPFRIVGNEEKGYFLTIGTYRISEIVKTKDAVAYLLHAGTNYEIIFNMISVVVTETIKEISSQANNNKPQQNPE